MALLCLALLVPPEANAQPGRGFFAADVQDQDGRPGGPGARHDWRNTLDGQGRNGEVSQQRRKMSQEERSSLRQHMRDAARGAYPDDFGSRKNRR